MLLPGAICASHDIPELRRTATQGGMDLLEPTDTHVHTDASTHTHVHPCIHNSVLSHTASQTRRRDSTRDNQRLVCAPYTLPPCRMGIMLAAPSSTVLTHGPTNIASELARRYVHSHSRRRRCYASGESRGDAPCHRSASMGRGSCGMHTRHQTVRNNGV